MLEDAMAAVLGHLNPFVPPSSGTLPDNSVRISSATGRSLAIGGRRGSEYRFGFPVGALKGVHLDAVVRLVVWSASPGGADDLLETVHNNLLSASTSLRGLGFLKFEAIGSLIAERVESEGAWRKAAEFELLYEHHFIDSDDAESLIVRIPIQSDLEIEGANRSTETVVNGMRRWDNESAVDLILRGGRPGSRQVAGLTSLDFRPGAFAGAGVTVERLTLNNASPPTNYGAFDDFLEAISGPDASELHGRFEFASLTDFLTALDPPGATFLLGDWDADSVTDGYTPRHRLFSQPVELKSPRDLFALRYQDVTFPSPGVLYLEALT